MAVVECHVVDVRRGVVQQGRHGLAVPAYRTRHHLTVDIEMVGVGECHLVIRFPDILSRVFRHHVHRRNQPQSKVAFLHVEAELRIDIVLDVLDVEVVLLPIFIDTVQYLQRVFFGCSHLSTCVQYDKAVEKGFE